MKGRIGRKEEYKKERGNVRERWERRGMKSREIMKGKEGEEEGMK